MTYAGKIANMAVKYLFKKPATIVDPNDAPGIEQNYRGKLLYDPTNCIDCRLCKRDCPANAIDIVNEGTKEEKKMKIIYNVGHCIFCTQCVDTCPKKCLSFTQNILLSSMSKDDLIGPL
jgi:formate hydrogenlyase subunit 6/NADH:ubiquinone oxidoreductase subunit I